MVSVYFHFEKCRGGWSPHGVNFKLHSNNDNIIVSLVCGGGVL